jgi:undecaprenyl pyrophosphate synthase
LPNDVLTLLDDTIAKTAGNQGMRLCLAISYGARQELADAVRADFPDLPILAGELDENRSGSGLLTQECS